MAIKINLEKAFNKISRSFLRYMLSSIKNPTKLTNIIISCISTLELAILFNENSTIIFKPNRGVKQGHPLSPYLFILGMEHLSRLINQQINQSNWTTIAIKKNGPFISHTLFADDVFLFVEATIDNAHTIMNVPTEFFSSSGLNMNPNKSKNFFSNNCDDNMCNQISNILTIKRVNNLGSYLGFPIQIKSPKHSDFYHLFTKLESKLCKWKS